MKKKILVLISILILTIFVGLLAGCNKLKPVQFDFEAGADNLMQGASIAGEKLTNSEIKNRQKMLKAGNSSWQAKSGATTNNVEFKLKDTYTFNTAVISEIGDNVRHFTLEAFVSSKWQLIYASEKINDKRIISFDNVTTDSIRFTINNFKETSCKIKSFELYNLTTARETFNTTVYQRIDGEDRPSKVVEKGEDYIKKFARYYDVYNNVIVFEAVNWTKEGQLEFFNGEAHFAEEITALKKIISYRTNPHKVNIIVTALADGAGGGHIGVNTLMHSQHTRIATEMADKFIKSENEGGYDLDGLDIDWEYPQNKDDWACYDVFMKELHDKMTAIKPNAIISTAISAGAMGMSEETVELIDQIQYMAYDDFDADGYQSTIYFAHMGVASFAKKGVSLSKVNIGIPTYGRPTNYGSYWPYWKSVTGNNIYFGSLYTNIECGGKLLADSVYCSPALAGDKTALALFSGCGGIMVFRLACDKLMDDPNAIACGIENTLKRYNAKW